MAKQITVTGATALSMLVISHDPIVVNRLADRTLALTSGRLASAAASAMAEPAPA